MQLSKGQATRRGIAANAWASSHSTTTLVTHMLLLVCEEYRAHDRSTTQEVEVLRHMKAVMPVKQALWSLSSYRLRLTLASLPFLPLSRVNSG